MAVDPRAVYGQDSYEYVYPPMNRDTIRGWLDILRGRSIPAPTTPPGQLFGGTADINKFRGVFNPDGTVSTVRTGTYGFSDDTGREVTYLLPNITPEGYYLSEKQVVPYFRQYGQHFGGFNSVAAGRAAGDRLHEAEEIRIENPDVYNSIRRLWTDI